MPKWKEISKLSSKEASKREAEFEAAMIEELAKSKAPHQPTVEQATDSITISVTEDGKTTTYSDLASVPLALRQRILNVWLSIAGK